MGMIYRNKYRRADGTVGTSAVWWIKYYRDGHPIRESSETTKHDEAKRLLKLREGAVERGVPVTPRMGRIRFQELLDDLIADYNVNRRRSLDVVERRIRKHVGPVFARRRASTISTSDVRRYVASRQEAGASNAEINRELAALKRAFTLAMQAAKVLTRPHIPMLQQDNIRTGFFERDQFEAVRDRLPEPLRAVETFLYLTGWRIREVLGLHWRHVDFEAGAIRLDPGTTKNAEGREFPFTNELRALLDAQRDHTGAVQRAAGIVSPWVFHRNGRAIRDFYTAWRKACRDAGCPGRIPHDFRRTAVRNLVRDGIPERVAMTMTGHKTRSVFERYNIVSGGDLADAARKINAGADAIAGKASSPRASAPSLTVVG